MDKENKSHTIFHRDYGCCHVGVFLSRVLLAFILQIFTDPGVKCQFSSVQSSRSVVSDSAPPWIAAHEASLSITNSWSSLKLTSSSRWRHPAISSLVVPFSSCPQSLPASVFSNESALCMRWPKCWSFSFSIIPSKEHPGQISFRKDWLDLLTVQGTLKSLLQHHSSKASIFQHSAFFTFQQSHPYMTAGKAQPWLDGRLLAK